MRKLLADRGPFVMKNMIAGSTFLGLFCGSRGRPETEATKSTRFYLVNIEVKAG
jgi:hypothetical protein